MSEIEIGGVSYENARNNAYWTRVHLDTSFLPDAEDALIYKNHIEDCFEHPTSGMLIRRKYITKKPFNYPVFARRNLKLMENEEVIKGLKKQFDNLLSKLYPKTKHLREYIIQKDRINLDFVKSAQKYTKTDKLLIALKRFI